MENNDQFDKEKEAHDPGHCDCGHDHSHDHGHDHTHEDMETVTITFDDNTDVECAVLGIFEAEGRDYIALVPLGDEEVLVYRYAEADGEAELTQIASDEEYEAVSLAFHEMMSEDEEDEN
ncbi:MAG: DUF1292 domain-containing protein [Clostridiales bacterium]|jgi:uncharacterized protein YrzB (UPF0473 family)|nr:DUF1292 domain-containing protein [Clostridiales bacterium]